MKKVVLSFTLALLTGASLLAGCATQTQEPERNRQDEVVISISSEPDTLDPCQGWGHGTTPWSKAPWWNMTMTCSLSTTWQRATPCPATASPGPSPSGTTPNLPTASR